MNTSCCMFEVAFRSPRGSEAEYLTADSSPRHFMIFVLNRFHLETKTYRFCYCLVTMPNQKPIRKLPFRPRPGQRKAAFNQSRGPTNAEAKKAWQQIGIAPSSDESQEIWGAIKGFLSTNFPETLEKRTLLPSKLSSMLRGFLDKEGPQFFSGTNPRYSATVPYTPLFDDAQ